MKSGWKGHISNSPEETIKMGKSLSEFIEKGDIIMSMETLLQVKQHSLKVFC